MELELKRKKIFKSMKSTFFKILNNKQEIKIKELSFRKWYYFQFVINTLTKDPVIPNIEKISEDHLKFVKEQIPNIDPLHLLTNMKKFLNKISIKSNNMKIDKTVVIKKYKNDISLSNSNQKFKIPKKIYKKLIKLNNNIYDVFVLIYRYKYTGLWQSNTQLSINDNIAKIFRDKLNVNYEMFASPINSQFKYYCSMFPDIEYKFGSIGNFFNYTPGENEIIEANPPFSEQLMKYMVKRMLKFIKKYNNLTYILFIPVWDITGKTILKSKKLEDDYNEFDAMKIIRDNPKYITNTILIPKKFISYKNPFTLKVINNVSDTYIITIQSKNAKKITYKKLKAILNIKSEKYINDIILVK